MKRSSYDSMKGDFIWETDVRPSISVQTLHRKRNGHDKIDPSQTVRLTRILGGKDESRFAHLSVQVHRVSSLRQKEPDHGGAQAVRARAAGVLVRLRLEPVHPGGMDYVDLPYSANTDSWTRNTPSRSRTCRAEGKRGGLRRVPHRQRPSGPSGRFYMPGGTATPS